MKIVYLITKSEIGGAQSHILELLKEGSRLGFEVSLISSPGGWLENQCVDLNIKFIPNKFFKNSYNPLNLFKSISLVRKIFKKEKPDIIHCHSGGGGFYGRLAALGLPVKKVFTVHGWSFRPGAPFFQRVVSFVAELLMKPLTDKVICVSNYDQNIGINSGVINKKSSIVIHNGVVVPEISENIDDKINIIFVGRLAPPKRQDIFLKTISLLSSDIKNKINVEILGDGLKRKDIENLCQNLGLQDLTSIESIPTEFMGQKYFHADILVLISDYEAFPMVIIEAMSYGVPVVTSSVGGIPEVVDSSVGLLIKKNTPEDFANALESLVLNSEERKQKGINARERIQANFTLEKMLGETFAVYSELMSENNLNRLDNDSKI
ncbi:MAG: glycosyltransferase family 4 protein [Candidatus Paceibacterota bacterium]